MSLSGWLNDTLTGNPPGTADAQSNAIAAGQTTILTNYQTQYQQGLITAQQYAAITGDFSTQAPPSNSISATGQVVGGGVAGLIGAAANPGQVLQTGLAWEGKVVGDAIGNVAGGVQSGVWQAILNIVKKIPWWVWLLLVAYIIQTTVGFGFLKGRIKALRKT